MLIYEELSKKVINAYYNVQRILGKGLAEKVYENALCIELEEMGVPYVRQKELSVEYKGHNIGNNYINLTHSKVGYILNFSQQEGLGFKRLLGLSARSEE